MSATETDLDLDYIKSEASRIVNDFARRDEIDSDQVTWLVRTIADLAYEVERLCRLRSSSS